MVLRMSPHEQRCVFQPFLHTNTTVHSGKETQAFRDEHLLAEHVGVKILGCVMGREASYVPHFSLFSLLSSTGINSLFPSSTSSCCHLQLLSRYRASRIAPPRVRSAPITTAIL